MTSSELEVAWLAYARRVLTDTSHIQSCAALGGSPSHPGVDATDLRWPGYLGERAQRGQLVLAMGNVHRNFASGKLTSDYRDRLVQATRGWRDGSVTDAAFLETTREVYLAGLGGWTVGKHLGYAVAALGLDLRSIAYVNAARCQYPEVPPRLPRAAGTKLALQKLCTQRYTVAALVEMLHPRVVLFTSTSAYDTVPLSASDTLTVCLHQLNGTLARPLLVGGRHLPAGTPRATWAAALAATLNG